VTRSPDLTRDDVEIVEKATVYKGRFQVDRYRLRHKLHDGGWSEPFVREVFERGHAAAVLPYDPVLDRMVLIEQFRPGAYAAGLHPWLIEAVAGIIDPGETAEQVIRREAVEEAGVEIFEIEKVAKCMVTPGACSEYVDIHVGRVDASKCGGVHGLAHEHENIRAFTLSVDEAERMLAAQEFTNVVTIVAVQWLLLNRMRLRDSWGAFRR
jgi:ADP-ribose pyrophosphatase